MLDQLSRSKTLTTDIFRTTSRRLSAWHDPGFYIRAACVVHSLIGLNLTYAFDPITHGGGTRPTYSAAAWRA